MILNLKSLNQHVQYQHFKMYSVWETLGLMTTNCYMASIDLKDPYFSVPIAKSHQHFANFSRIIRCIDLHLSPIHRRAALVNLQK